MKRFTFFSFFLLCGFAAFSQQVSKTRIESHLRTLRNNLSAVVTNDNALKEQLSQCKQIINEAIINIDSKDVNYTSLYEESIEGLNNLAIALPKYEPAAQQTTVHLIYRDLQLKFRNKSHGIVGLGYSQAVVVKVITKGISGLRVNYTPAGNTIDYQHPDHQFKHVTSPASEEMPPGIYEIWLTRDNSTSVIKHLEIEVDPDHNDNTVEF